MAFNHGYVSYFAYQQCSEIKSQIQVRKSVNVFSMVHLHVSCEEINVWSFVDLKYIVNIGLYIYCYLQA